MKWDGDGEDEVVREMSGMELKTNGERRGRMGERGERWRASPDLDGSLFSFLLDLDLVQELFLFDY